jgi:hypothetical protein
VPSIKPMKQEYSDELTATAGKEMRGGVNQRAPFAARVVSPLRHLRGGNSQLALGIGHGMIEDRPQVPRLHELHNFNMTWLRATSGR